MYNVVICVYMEEIEKDLEWMLRFRCYYVSYVLSWTFEYNITKMFNDTLD